jgi:thiol-disulfide isomerase/thioredoxin
MSDRRKRVIGAARRYATLAIASLSLLAGGAWALEFRDFDAKSANALRAAYTGKPFILAFWSIYCEPCRHELTQWAPLQRQYPGIPIVLVATDPPRDRAMLNQMLGGLDLAGVQTWAFADAFEERIRYGIDRAWRGELPRTYLFDAAHQVEARSGPAERAWLDAWLTRQTGAREVDGRGEFQGPRRDP